MVGVEVAHLLGQLGPAAEGLRDQHRHRVLGRAAAEHEQLQQAVERRRVRDVVAQQRADLGDVVAEQRRRQLQLAGPHPVAVPAQRVDLAVVGEHPVGMRELPAREGVGGEARVDEREPADDALVAQVGVVARQLRRRQHPLVDDRPRGEARQRQVGEVRSLDHAADHVQPALERILVGDGIVRRDEQLGDPRRHRARRRPAGALGDRHVAPAEHVLALVLDGLLEQPHRLRGVARREEAHRDPVAAGGRQLEVDLGAQERVRDLQQDAGAVARVRVGALRAAVLHVLEREQRAADHLVGGGRTQPRHEGDAAGVVLVARVVQAMRCLQRGHLLLVISALSAGAVATGMGAQKDTENQPLNRRRRAARAMPWVRSARGRRDHRSLPEGRHRQDHHGEDARGRLPAGRDGRARGRSRPPGEPLRLLRRAAGCIPDGGRRARRPGEGGRRSSTTACCPPTSGSRRPRSC